LGQVAGLEALRSPAIVDSGDRNSAPEKCIPVLFDLLREKADPAARVVLGHFVFVYIHPYMDGNGRY
jgi:Fic family protein